MRRTHEPSRVEPLERRTLLSGNLQALGLALLDYSTNEPLVNPPAGTQVRVKATFRAEGISQGTTIRFLREVNPGGRYMDVVAEQSWESGTTVEKEFTSWAVPPGITTMKLVADTLNAIAESDEDDNTFTLSINGGSYASPRLAVPIHHSLQTAAHALYLDFDGNFESSWLNYSNVITPTFDLERNPSLFTESEKDAIHAIWSAVAEDFSPFNIDVTTEKPASGQYERFQHLVIGGTTSDWVSGNEGGIAPLGTFSGDSWRLPGFAFVSGYYDNTIAEPSAISAAVSHEAGHTFGLAHQSRFDDDGTLIETYRKEIDGDSPIMGHGYIDPATWDRGPTPDGPNSIQDDLQILSGDANGFGYRPDDGGNAFGSATGLGTLAISLTASGIVGRNSDVDFFSFDAPAGEIKLTLNAASIQPNLDGVLKLYDAAGNLIASDNPADKQGASIVATLSSGRHFASVESTGKYGRIGQYTLNVNVSTNNPRLELTNVAGTILPVDSPVPVDFGNIPLGQTRETRYTITNTGGQTLQLGQPTVTSGFTATIADQTLAEGKSTELRIVASAVATGTASGSVSFTSNDSERASIGFALTLNVPTPAAPDLEVKSLKLGKSTYIAGQEVKLQFRIANSGDRRFNGRVPVQLLLSGDGVSSEDDVILKTRSQKVDLRPGRSIKTQSISTRLPATLVDGTWQVMVVVDPQGTSGDNDLTNNAIASNPLTLIARRTDLAVTFSATPIFPNPGKSRSINLRVSNVGNVTLNGRVGYELILSTDGQIDAGDVMLKSFNRTEKLSAGKRIKRFTKIRGLDVLPGQYFILARGTVLSGFTDTDLTNNLATASVVTPV